MLALEYFGAMENRGLYTPCRRAINAESRKMLEGDVKESSELSIIRIINYRRLQRVILSKFDGISKFEQVLAVDHRRVSESVTPPTFLSSSNAIL